LRLKLESKLNNMHSAHRDLESKYKRVLVDFKNAKKQVKNLSDKINLRNTKRTEFKTIQTEN
jgi:hypothetical protein